VGEEEGQGSWRSKSNEKEWKEKLC